MKKAKLIGKMLPKEIREKPEAKIILAILSGAGALISLFDIVNNGKLTFTSVISGSLSLAALNEAIEDVKEVIDEESI